MRAGRNPFCEGILQNTSGLASRYPRRRAHRRASILRLEEDSGPSGESSFLVDQRPGEALDPQGGSGSSVRRTAPGSYETLTYWLDKTLYAMTTKFCPQKLVLKVQGTGWAEAGGYFHQGGAHFNPPWELILEKGLAWYEQRVAGSLSDLDDSNPEHMGKEHFYQALLLSIEAIRDFAAKYAKSP
jgi:formate C-acetyltransferase